MVGHRGRPASSISPKWVRHDAVKDRIRHANPILMAMVRSHRTDPSVPRGPCHGETRWQTTLPRPGEVLAADDPGAAAERARRPCLLPSRGPEGRGLPLVAA